MKIKVKDPIIKRVIKKFVGRSNVGYKKYGVTLMDDSSNLDEWLNHLQEELMDAVNYIERAREQIDRQRILYNKAMQFLAEPSLLDDSPKYVYKPTRCGGCALGGNDKCCQDDA